MLHGEMSTDPDRKLDIGSYLSDDHELLCHAPAGKGEPLLVIHRALDPGLPLWFMRYAATPALSLLSCGYTNASIS